jgi:peroxiredoxin
MRFCALRSAKRMAYFYLMKQRWILFFTAILPLPFVLGGCGQGDANSETVVGHQSGEALSALPGSDTGKRYKLDPNLPHSFSKTRAETPVRRVKINEVAPDFSLTMLDGSKKKLSDFKGKATLFMFADTTCPCVLAYHDRMKALDEKFGERGLQTVYIFSNGKTDTKEKIAKFVKDKSYSWPIALDLDQKLLKQFDAACSTEVFLFDAKSRLRYHGRIDDDTFEPKAVRERDLQSAVVAVLDGRGVPVMETKAFGCAIVRLG